MPQSRSPQPVRTKPLSTPSWETRWAGVSRTGFLLTGILLLALAAPLQAETRWDTTGVQANLRQTVEVLATDIGERNMDAPRNYLRAAACITDRLTSWGVAIESLRPIPQPPSPPVIVAAFGPAPTPAALSPAPRNTPHQPTPSALEPSNLTQPQRATHAMPDTAPELLLCAHYDTVPGAPGANDNASGVAVLLELARLLAASPPLPIRLQIVFFPNEEEPHFMTPSSGSVLYAQLLAALGTLPARVVAVDSVGWPGKDAGWRSFMRFSRGNLTVGARPASRQLADDLAQALGRATDTDAVVTRDGAFWIDLSDHAPFAARGCQAVLLTAPGTLAYPCLHLGCDTPEKLDYKTMENTVRGLLEFIAQPPSTPAP